MTTLHVFDMDGTLLRGTTASLQIARHLGSTAELVKLEARFATGELDTRAFAAAIHELWRDLTPSAVTTAFDASPWLTGITAVCADIRSRGERSMVITMAPDFFAQHRLTLGFDEVVASRFPTPPFLEPLDPANVLTPRDKVRIVDEMCERYAVPRAQCVAYGDSMSDAPLFRHLTRRSRSTPITISSIWPPSVIAATTWPALTHSAVRCSPPEICLSASTGQYRRRLHERAA